jgi:hypothetical protein
MSVLERTIFFSEKGFFEFSKRRKGYLKIIPALKGTWQAALTQKAFGSAKTLKLRFFMAVYPFRFKVLCQQFIFIVY